MTEVSEDNKLNAMKWEIEKTSVLASPNTTNILRASTESVAFQTNDEHIDSPTNLVENNPDAQMKALTSAASKKLDSGHLYYLSDVRSALEQNNAEDNVYYNHFQHNIQSVEYIQSIFTPRVEDMLDK